LSSSSDPSRITAIVGATIIDGNGDHPVADGIILIEGKRIAALGDRSLEVPKAARTIHASGKYVIPGLMDANVHLVLDHWPLTMIRYEGRYDELALEAAQITLKSGVTTVFDTWGPRKYLAKARTAINAGHSIGSRVNLGGNIVGFGGPYSADFLPQAKDLLFDQFTARINAIWQEDVGPELVYMSPRQVAQRVREHAQKDIDFVKYAVTGHSPDRDEQYILFSPRVQAAIVSEAHKAGKTVQTHTTSGEGLYLAVEAGVDLLQHASTTPGSQAIPDETVSLIAQRRVPCALLANTTSALLWFREQARAAPFFKRYENTDLNDRALIEAGTVILLSTDGGVFSSDVMNSALWKKYVPPAEGLLCLGEGHFNWLLAVEQKGMKPMDALMAATRNIARAYKVDKDLGTLEQGKIADLLILDKDPLQSAANYRSITLVMKEGSIVDRDSLPDRKFLTATALAH
jgi:imidazolonepropionase-like amidohydrolase